MSEKIPKLLSEEGAEEMNIEDLTRSIRNAKRKLERLRDRRTNSPEAQEALRGSPLATNFVVYIDGEISKLEKEISRLETERDNLRGK